MNANSNQKPTASELYDIIKFWFHSFHNLKSYQKEKFGHKGKKNKGYI
jgi:hypothetical protein